MGAEDGRGLYTFGKKKRGDLYGLFLGTAIELSVCFFSE